MKEPKNAITKQFEVLFKMDNIDLEIKNDALIEIAKLAVQQKTGARGLRSIIEDLLIDLMYDSPDQKDLEKIVLEIKGFLDILSSRKTLLEVIKKELKGRFEKNIINYFSNNYFRIFWLINYIYY